MNSLIAKLVSLSLIVNPEGGTGNCKKDCQISENGLALIRTFEGYSPFIYKDSAGLDTIGYGHLVVKGDNIPEPLLPEDANKILLKDTEKAVKGLNKYTHVTLKQNQADSLISFTYNVGVGSLSKSTLVKKVNEEKHEEVPNQFMRWVRAGGKVIKGLVTRRETEANLYKQ